MIDKRIVIKGNREGLNVTINLNGYKDFEDMLKGLVAKLNKGKRFYKGSTINITTELSLINRKEMNKLKDVLFEEFMIKDCVFEDSSDKVSKVFSGIYEGRTKFIRKTIRSGQVVEYNGNIVVIGDVNPGGEISASGNVIVLGSLRGHVHAGNNGNDKALISAFSLQPQILQIANYIARAPEGSNKPSYPEVAKIKNKMIIVEPYLPNKFI